MATRDSKSARQDGGEGGGEQRAGDERTDKHAGQSHYVYLLTVIGAVGGLLWGYDTGVIAGALSPLARTFNLGSFTKELAVAAVLIGTIIGALCAGRLADRSATGRCSCSWRLSERCS